MNSRRTKKQTPIQLKMEKQGNFLSLKAKGKIAILLAVILLCVVAFFLFSQQTTSGDQSPAIKEFNGSISYKNGTTQ